MKQISQLMRRPFLLAAVASILSLPVGAATIDVSAGSGDVIDNDGVCSLREAVIAANDNAASGAAAGECAAGEDLPTVDTINIPAGTYSLTIDPSYSLSPSPSDSYTFGEYTLTWNVGEDKFLATVTAADAADGDLDITESVNLVGAGSGTTIIDAGWDPQGAAVNDPAVDPNAGATSVLNDRVLHVVDPTSSTTVDVQISGLTIKGGSMEEVTGLVNLAAEEYYLRMNGGGLAVGVAAGTYDPLTSGGGQPVIDPGGGGADYTLDLSDVVFMQNYAGDGGGFYNGATTTADMIEISGNHAFANGGGLYNDGDLTLTDSTIDDNGAEGGGGMFDTGTGNRSISGSTLSNNGAVGGGAYSGRAGVILDMTNSTVSDNFARDMGGGLLTNGTLNLVHVTVANNIATTDAPAAGAGVMTFPSGPGGTQNEAVTLKDVLLQNNLIGTVATSNADCGYVGSSLSVTSLGYNLSHDVSCALGQATDLSDTDADLQALADNGGPTLTHALLAGSWAVNNGGMLGAVTLDQRGEARDSMPDIGAYEYIAPPVNGGGTGSADDDDDSRCFIATAAYGSYLDPKVKVLRDFRDRQLLTNNIGSELVAFYYRNSPPIADYIRDREVLRTVVRSLLTVVVYSIEYPLSAMLLIFMLLTIAVRVAKKRAHAS